MLYLRYLIFFLSVKLFEREEVGSIPPKICSLESFDTSHGCDHWDLVTACG